MLPCLTERLRQPVGRPPPGPRRPPARSTSARDEVAARCSGCRPGEVVFTAAAPRPTTSPSSASHAGPARRRCGVQRRRAPRRARPVEAVGGRSRRRRRRRPGRPRRPRRGARADDVAVVSVMLANNEVGTVQPPAPTVAAVVRERAPHAAAPHRRRAGARAGSTSPTRAGRRPTWSAVSAHKFGGPKGVGALVVRPGTPLRARQLGGGPGARPAQRHPERRRRRRPRRPRCGSRRPSGPRRVERVGPCRDRLADGLRGRRCRALVETRARPATARLSPAPVHVCVRGVESEALLFLLDEAGVSRVGRLVAAPAAPTGVPRPRGHGRRPGPGGGVAAPLARLVDHRRRRRPRPRRRARRRRPLRLPAGRRT